MKTIDELVSYLKKCDESYYNTDKPIVSNDTYDSLVESLKRLDPSNSYLNKVGAEPRVGSSKVGRLIPMGTLSKYHEDNEVREWVNSHGNDKILLSPKYDGFGVELLYVNGKLSMASTRGTGYTGEDVTEAMKLINYVPVNLPDQYKSLIRVRGEAIIPRENHEIMKSLGYTAMRNAVPGIVRSCNKEALKYVDFVAYEFFDERTSRFSQRIFYENLFNVEDTTIYDTNDFAGISLQRESFGKSKDLYKYEVDGMVLKTDAIRFDDLLCPKHQIAWKFKSKYKETILREIRTDVGAAGNISVVGVFDPVEFQGAQLTSASFGSLQRYNDLKAYIGCTLEVSRRGDIIPMIENVLDPDEDKFVPIDTCPCCGTVLINYKCPNKSCKDKIQKKTLQYIQSFGIKGIGGSLVSKLVESSIITNLTDIYKLDPEIIRQIPKQGDSSVVKWRELQTKEVSLLKFLCSYPFEGLGESVWKPLLEKITIYQAMEMNITELMNLNLKGLGETKAFSLYNQLQDSREEITELLSLVNIR